MDYSQAALPVRDAVAQAHAASLARIAAPGAWWSGADRRAIAEETRAAPDCALCARAADSLSPEAAEGEHSHKSDLPPIAVEAVHRIRNDSGRLTRRWFEHVVDMGMQPPAYVELVSVAASSVIVDTYAQAIGLEPPTLPEAAPGGPTLEVSEAVADGGAYVPIAREGRANILRSLGLVPSASELFFSTFSQSYFMRPDASFAIGRRQVELVASKVSAVNECFY